MITSTIKDGALKIKIGDTFKFQSQGEFRAAYENNTDKSITKILIDFSNTKYLDSSALGMLLILKEYVEKNPAMSSVRVELVDCSKEVKEILTITHFNKLFKIS